MNVVYDKLEEVYKVVKLNLKSINNPCGILQHREIEYMGCL